MWIACGTATFLCKVKSHRGEPLNEAADDLADLGRTQNHRSNLRMPCGTTRSDRMVLSWIDGQKNARTYVNVEPGCVERNAIGSGWTTQIRSTITARSAQLAARVDSDFLSREGEGRDRLTLKHWATFKVRAK
jgi:hypothetical protein